MRTRPVMTRRSELLLTCVQAARLIWCHPMRRKHRKVSRAQSLSLDQSVNQYPEVSLESGPVSSGKEDSSQSADSSPSPSIVVNPANPSSLIITSSVVPPRPVDNDASPHLPSRPVTPVSQTTSFRPGDTPQETSCGLRLPTPAHRRKENFHVLEDPNLRTFFVSCFIVRD